MKLSILTISLFSSLALFASSAMANSDNLKNTPLPSPGDDANFLKLSSGENLSKLRVRGRGLSLTRGGGGTFSKKREASFSKLYAEGKNTANAPYQWVVMNLDTGKILDQSKSADMKMFGASVSKIFVGATYVHTQSGEIDKQHLQRLANMLVVSSNPAWLQLQKDIGNGNANEGRKTIHEFTQSMGYERTRGFQNYLKTDNNEEIHGNELTAKELAAFLYDTYWQKYEGAEVMWKLMHTLRTGGSKANKYLPSNLYLGGKTGTYSGSTVDPETGAEHFPNGKKYSVQVRHQVVVFNYEGTQYALALLTNKASNEHVSLLAAGLFNKIIKKEHI
jgi:hypothetical protein